MDALSKSQNKHNRIFMRATPMDEELSLEIEAGRITPRDEIKARARVMAENHGNNFFILVYCCNGADDLLMQDGM